MRIDILHQVFIRQISSKHYTLRFSDLSAIHGKRNLGVYYLRIGKILSDVNIQGLSPLTILKHKQLTVLVPQIYKKIGSCQIITNRTAIKFCEDNIVCVHELKI
ncbi:hypothetical protein DSECCO2_619050 [anaerobic digester metagenome]